MNQKNISSLDMILTEAVNILWGGMFCPPYATYCSCAYTPTNLTALIQLNTSERRIWGISLQSLPLESSVWWRLRFPNTGVRIYTFNPVLCGMEQHVITPFPEQEYVPWWSWWWGQGRHPWTTHRSHRAPSWWPLWPCPWCTGPWLPPPSP